MVNVRQLGVVVDCEEYINSMDCLIVNSSSAFISLTVEADTVVDGSEVADGMEVISFLFTSSCGGGDSGAILAEVVVVAMVVAVVVVVVLISVVTLVVLD